MTAATLIRVMGKVEKYLIRYPYRAARPNGSNLGRHMVYALLALICAAMPAAAQRVADPQGYAEPAPQQADEYVLAPGDQVAIVYPYNAELNYEGTVGPDGRLTLPLAGAVRVSGLTSSEAEGEIAAALRRRRIVEDARPSLSVRTYAGSVFVGGEVRNPGAVRLAGPLDAMRAIILAGGLLDTAKSTRVVVIRQMPDGRASLRYVDLRAYVKAGGVGQDETLRAQDVVFVPRSSVAEANLWIDQHINRMLPFSRSLNFNVGNGTTTSIGR